MGIRAVPWGGDSIPKLHIVPDQQYLQRAKGKELGEKETETKRQAGGRIEQWGRKDVLFPTAVPKDHRSNKGPQK